VKEQHKQEQLKYFRRNNKVQNSGHNSPSHRSVVSKESANGDDVEGFTVGDNKSEKTIQGLEDKLIM